jgi:hypothetical protein
MIRFDIQASGAVDLSIGSNPSELKGIHESISQEQGIIAQWQFSMRKL